MKYPEYIYVVATPGFIPNINPEAVLMKRTQRSKQQNWPEYEKAAEGPVDQIKQMCIALNKGLEEKEET